MFETFLLYLALVFLGIFVAEVGGYWIHKLIHVEPEWFEKGRFRKLFRFMSRSHMGHHGLAYGVRMVQRPSKKYFFFRNTGDQESKKTRWGFLMPEFTVPALFSLSLYFFFLLLVGFTLFSALFSLSVTVLWVAICFLYVHDTFHKTSHWLGRFKLTKKWYHKMRELHDFHHMMLEAKAKLPYNLGIATPVGDILFGSYLPSTDTIVVDSKTGQLMSSKIPEDNYKYFHKIHGIKEPEFDENVDEEVRKMLK